MTFARTHISLKSELQLVGTLLLLVTAVEIVNLVLGRSLNSFGLVPRDAFGAIGIAFAPFLHGNLMHYFSNIIPLGIFSFLLLQHGAVRFWLVSISIIVMSGLLVWLFGRTASHVGASGLIFGYFGYLLVAGFVSKEIKLILVSAFIAIFYGGMIWGVLPGMPFVSWEFHLFGFIAGVLCALKWGRAQG